MGVAPSTTIEQYAKPALKLELRLKTGVKTEFGDEEVVTVLEGTIEELRSQVSVAEKAVFDAYDTLQTKKAEAAVDAVPQEH